jgi:hypothetical protein
MVKNKTRKEKGESFDFERCNAMQPLPRQQSINEYVRFKTKEMNLFILFSESKLQKSLVNIFF